MLKAATPDAAQLMIDTMKDSAVKLDLRLDCAKEIINRVYGRPSQPIDGNLEGELVVQLVGEVGDYAG